MKTIMQNKSTPNFLFIQNVQAKSNNHLFIQRINQLIKKQNKTNNKSPSHTTQTL